MANIIKARERTGTSSLDLTLPAKLKKKHDINKGDVFKVDTIDDNGQLKIVYTLIFKNE